MKPIALIILLTLSGAALGQSTSLTVREINQLFVMLENSKCEFNRNGSWYNSKKATAHLRQKYAYLQKKRLLTSTESLIDLAATKSSLSGKPYLVRCGKSPPVPSKIWLTEKLKQLRGRSVGANNSFNPMPLRGTG